MASVLFRVVVLVAMIVGGWAGVSMYQESTNDAKLREKDKVIAEERQKNDLLRGIVKRLQTDKRVARIVVTDQKEVDGRTETTILFSEYDRDGKTPLPMRRFVLDGKGAHIDALVLEFEGKYVEENDPLRGHAVALFRRVFGDNQAPNAGFTLDSAGEAPAVYKNSDPRLAKLEADLWKDFWRLADDPQYRQQYGVKLAYGASTYREEFKKGYVYNLVLSPTGGLKMTPEKMDALWERSLSELIKPKT